MLPARGSRAVITSSVGIADSPSSASVGFGPVQPGRKSIRRSRPTTARAVAAA